MIAPTISVQLAAIGETFEINPDRVLWAEPAEDRNEPATLLVFGVGTGPGTSLLIRHSIDWWRGQVVAALILQCKLARDVPLLNVQ